jgi:hypothetical protein
MRVVFAVALAAVSFIAVPSAQSNMAKAERFSAFAVDISTMTSRARTSPVDIVINRWSTDAERDQLLSVLQDKGQDALLTAVQKLPAVGYISTPGSLRYELHFARQTDEAEGGRSLFLMTDRYVGAWEASNRPRTIDYPFSLFNLQIDKAGNGEGNATLFTKIRQAKDGTIELENFANQPVKLNLVKKVG